MSQVVGNPNFGYQGEIQARFASGPCCIFAGTKDPRTFTDASSGSGRVSCNDAAVNSLFIVDGVGVLVKTALDPTQATSGTWTLLTVP